MNLDGETNLKVRQGLPETANLIDAKDLRDFKGVIECDLPNKLIYDFTGTLTKPDSTTVEVETLFGREKYEILNVLDFTSARKRMSVIVKTPNLKIILFCKGADNVIFERLSNDGQIYCESTLYHLQEFANNGLRTLCCAMTEISEDKYTKWNILHHEASTALDARETKLEEVANMIEIDLKLLGATAVEDKLQDKVPETINSLLKADINVWVLTGDKQETAINIGYSTQLIVQGTSLIILNETSLDVVELVRSNTDEVTLAIGDGANDVAMIQKAHVGIGISGVEGLQAACASDYSIAQAIPIGVVMLGMDEMEFSSSVFWLGLIITPFTVIAFDLIILATRGTLFKTLTETVRELEIKKNDTSEVMAENKHPLSERARLLKNVRNVFTFRSENNHGNVELEMNRGYAFSQEEGGVVSQSVMIIMNLPLYVVITRTVDDDIKDNMDLSDDEFDLEVQ
ncbi:hypothetical protein PGB90_009345 [Kerria lacca]